MFKSAQQLSLATAGLLLVLAGCDSKDDSPPDVQYVGFGPAGVTLPYDADVVGSEKCQECHQSHYLHQSHHPMGRTAHRVTAGTADDWFAPELLAKPVMWPPGTNAPTVQYHREADGVFLQAPDGTKAKVAAVFGSGRHGFTPISIEDGRSIRQLRVSFFSTKDTWMMTPGMADDPDPLGEVISPEMSGFCLGCHTTVLSWKDDRLNLDASVLSIGCERCHGPASAHLQAVAQGKADLKIYNPGNLRPDRQVEFCSQCHRRPADIETQEVMDRVPVLARHAAAGLMLSACFRQSPPRDTISCLDCHNPHHAADRPPQAITASCLRCHGSPAEVHTTTLVDSSSDCVGCHMPSETRGFFGMTFVDHWIRVPGAPPPSASTRRNAYLQYLESEYRAAVERPGEGPEFKARRHMLLGEHLVAQGKREEALPWLLKALTFEPSYGHRVYTAREHYLADRKDEAIAILESAIDVEPDVSMAYDLLFRVYLRDREINRAQKTLDRWRRAVPYDPALNERRVQLEAARRRE